MSSGVPVPKTPKGLPILLSSIQANLVSRDPVVKSMAQTNVLLFEILQALSPALTGLPSPSSTTNVLTQIQGTTNEILRTAESYTNELIQNSVTNITETQQQHPTNVPPIQILRPQGVQA